MGLSAFYGQRKSEEESKQVLRDAIKMGCTFWDTADMYGRLPICLGFSDHID